MPIIDHVRRIIDREWIRVDWSGTQTLKHRAISLVPPAMAMGLASISPSLTLAIALGLAGVLGYVAMAIWIEGRRLKGTGALSTKRSERFVARMRRGGGAVDKEKADPGSNPG